MLIAIASTDGETVNEHFGRAERFWIIEASGTGQSLIAVRNVEPLSTGDKQHPFDRKRMDEVLGAIIGCERVYCTRIGARPRKELESRGIKPVIYSGSICGISL